MILSRLPLQEEAVCHPRTLPIRHCIGGIAALSLFRICGSDRREAISRRSPTCLFSVSPFYRLRTPRLASPPSHYSLLGLFYIFFLTKSFGLIPGTSRTICERVANIWGFFGKLLLSRCFAFSNLLLSRPFALVSSNRPLFSAPRLTLFETNIDASNAPVFHLYSSRNNGGMQLLKRLCSCE